MQQGNKGIHLQYITGNHSQIQLISTAALQ